MQSRQTALEDLTADPATAALLMDFDGVLSPIVGDPEQSVLPAATAGLIARLAGRLGLVLIISGRPLAFLASRITVPGVRLLGSYGLEQLQPDGSVYVEPSARDWIRVVREAGTELRQRLAGITGVRIEDKSVSVAVHWRQAQDPASAAAAIRAATAELAAATGLRLDPGKLTEELRPPVDVDKGTAVTAVLAAGQPRACAYVGDDLGDLPALEAVRAAGGYALVVDHGAETDGRMRAVADELFEGVAGFAQWLTRLAAAAGTSGP
jgi:trehalose 6-phosphate phosphatase